MAVRSKRTIVQAKVESMLGQDPGSWAAADAIPIYDAFNPLQAEIETIQKNRARATLDADGSIKGIPTYRLAGNFYVYGGGDAANGYTALTELPNWTRFIQGAGFTPAAPSSGEIVFSPVSDAHASLYCRVWLGITQHNMNSARGNLVFSARAGEPVTVAMDYLGGYNKGLEGQQTGMADVASDPGNPPRMCGTDTLRFLAENGDGNVFTPETKSVSLDLGVQVTISRDANSANCIAEIGIFQEFQPRLNCTIAVEDHTLEIDNNGARVNEWIEAMNQGDRFAFEWNIGSYVGTTGQGERFAFTNADDVTYDTGLEDTMDVSYRAELATAPQFDDDEGVRVYNLEFVLTGTNNNWLKIVAR